MIGVEEAAKVAGRRGDCRRVGERLPGQDGEEGMRRLGQIHVTGARIRPGQGVQGASEPPAGVGVAPCVGVLQHGGDGLAEFPSVSGEPLSRDLSGHALGLPPVSKAHACHGVRFSVRLAPAALRADDRGLDRAEDIELPVQAGDAYDLGHRRRRRGQSQEPAEQPRPAPGAHQNGEAAGIGVADLGHVDDHSADVGVKQAKELVTQGGRARDVELAAERGDDIASHGPG